MVERIFANLSIIIELDFCLSSLMIYQNITYGLLSYILSAVLVAIEALFLSNTTNINTFSFISSIQINLQYKSLLLLANLAFPFLLNVKIGNNYIIVLFLIYSASLSLWYSFYGYRLYIKKS